MTYHDDQRWVASVNPEVGELVLAHRDDVAFLKRFYSKVDTRPAEGDECYVWAAALSDEGYGNFTVGKRTVRAHRVAYILQFGEVPPVDRPFLDHVHPLCLYRFCVNPWHLEPVSPAENTRRGVGTGSAPQRAMRSAAFIARDRWALNYELLKEAA